MQRLAAAMATALALLAAATPMRADPQSSPAADLFGPPWAPARTAAFDLSPRDGARGDFRILVSVPDRPAPPGGYGIIYAMDAGWTFGTLRDALRLQGGGLAGAGIGPTVVVGIGWPTSDLVDFDRRGGDLVDMAGQGAGRDATLALLADQLIPLVEGRLPVDPARRMILGHSFGGAFALQALRRHPGLFSHVAAGSPSIWTDPDSLLGLTARADTRVLITVGEGEGPDAATAAGEPADRIARLRDRDMIGRARRLAQAVDGQFAVIAGMNHGGSVPAFLARAVAFLWGRD